MGIIREYTDTAMETARYEKLEDGKYCGVIPGLVGVIAFDDTLRGCQRELQSVLEDWILLGLKLKHSIPALNGIDLSMEPTVASLDAV